MNNIKMSLWFLFRVTLVLIAAVAIFLPDQSLASTQNELQCRAAMRGPTQSFVIADLLGAEPAVSNLDASFFEKNEGFGVTKICFSNECDNMYCFVFSNDDLREYSEGTRISLKGMLNYFNAWSAPNPGDEAEREPAVIGDTVFFECN